MYQYNFEKLEIWQLSRKLVRINENVELINCTFVELLIYETEQTNNSTSNKFDK